MIGPVGDGGVTMGGRSRRRPCAVMVERAVSGIEHQVQQRVRVPVPRAGPHLHGEQTQADESKRAKNA
jgi:hypothetical protein